MDFRKLKHEIAMSCKGDLKKYFNEVEILNNIIKKNSDINIDFNYKKYINKN